MDVEGAESKVIESGMELITKYQLPFATNEVKEGFMTQHGSNSKDFIKLFIDNGYFVSRKNFFPTKYEVFEKKQSAEQIYFTYKDYEK